MELATQALIFAAQAHDGARRKQTDVPYILHPAEVMAILGTMTTDQAVIAAGALHDVVEDAGVSLAELGERFGARVEELVAAETENKREELPPETTWLVRKQEAVQLLRDTADPDVKRLFLADKLSNIRSIYFNWRKEGEQVWLHFNQHDAAQQAWYYRAVAEATAELSDTLAWQEFSSRIGEIFAGVKA